MINVRVKSEMDTYTRLYVDAMNKACLQAVKSTSNDVIKWTLPNTPDNTAKNVPASRQRSTYRQNIKALRQRITGDIVGDSVTSAIPSARGNPIPRTIKGDGNMPYMLIDKGKGKRKKKKRKIALRIAKTPQELLEYIKKNTKLVKKRNATHRRRIKGSKVIWITRASIAKQASKIIEKRAGNTLSGWTALADRVDNNMLQSLLRSQDVDRRGTAQITQAGDKVRLRAKNDVNDAVSSYQRRIIDSSLPKTFDYHLKNSTKRINYKKINRLSRLR